MQRIFQHLGATEETERGCCCQNSQQKGAICRETNETHCCIIEVKLKQARSKDARIDLLVAMETKLSGTCLGLSAHQPTSRLYPRHLPLLQFVLASLKFHWCTPNFLLLEPEVSTPRILKPITVHNPILFIYPLCCSPTILQVVAAQEVFHQKLCMHSLLS